MRRPSANIIFCIISVFLVLTSCDKKNGEEGEDKESDKTLIPIEIAAVEKGNISAYYNGTTTLEAEGDAQVVAKVSGVVQELMVEEGNYVKSGDVLARLDGEILRVELARAEATLQRLEQNYKMKSALYDRDATSIDVYQQAKYEYEAQKAARDLVKLNMDYTEIKAPISGVVSERMIKVGNMVIANSAVFRITDFDPLLAVLFVPEREIGKLSVGQRTVIKVDALGEVEFTGTVDRISPVVDPRTGTIKVTIIVQDPSAQLKAGMFARASIVHDIHKNTLMIPREAVIREDEESSVFVVLDSMVMKQAVETGYVNTTHIEIISGITFNDSVVVTGQGSLKDSALIEVVANH